MGTSRGVMRAADRGKMTFHDRIDVMQSSQARAQEIDALEAQAECAARARRELEAVSLWNRILGLDPRHVRALTALGQRFFRKGDMQTARWDFQRLLDADGSDPQQWVNLALACQQLKDEPGEESAIQRALTTDPLDL